MVKGRMLRQRVVYNVPLGGHLLLVALVTQTLGCAGDTPPEDCVLLEREYRLVADAVYAYESMRQNITSKRDSEDYYKDILASNVQLYATVSEAQARLEKQGTMSTAELDLTNYYESLKKVIEFGSSRILNRVFLGVRDPQAATMNKLIDENYRTNLLFEKSFEAACK